MLSRTADHLYWMARYIERAENLARLLDVTYQMSLVPQSPEAANQNWNAIIVLNSLEKPFADAYGEPTAENVLRFMVRDEANLSSIYGCLRAARENAHAVRGTLTTEMWETINAAWIDLRSQSFEQIMAGGITEFFEWVKLRSALTRGVTFGTLLQDEAAHFIRMGGLLERADNTARILDVKYHFLEPVGEGEGEDGGVTDFYQWAALLRSLSAFEVYRKVYRDAITPARVAELLMLRMDMPRSLHHCLDKVNHLLGLVANRQSSETLRRAGLLHSRLHYARIEDVLAGGLHETLTEFMDDIYDLGNRISQDFLVPA
jgi:uncharacterized alpha-E superfamily protein